MSVSEALSYASIFGAVFTAVVTTATAIFMLVYLRDKSKSRYDELHRRAEISEMRKSYEDQMKTLTLQLSATDQRWTELNHLLLSSLQREPSNATAKSPTQFLANAGISETDLKVDPKLVLMLTPFGPSFDDSYHAVVEACRRVGLTCVRGDEEDAHGDILSHILRIMARAQLIIADIGSRNPNVYYELGIAHAMNKPTILISETISDVPFDIQSKRILLYKTPEELKTNLPETLARALAAQIQTPATQPNTTAPPTSSHANLRRRFVARTPSDGIGRLREPDEYLCVTNAGRKIYLPRGSYIFLRLFPEYEQSTLGDAATYSIGQANLRPLQGTRGGSWNLGRHESGTISFYANPQNVQFAIDASELFLTSELWANDFYSLNLKFESQPEKKFNYIATAAIEQSLTDSLRNFISIAREKLNVDLPVKVVAGLVGIQDYRLAVQPEFFGNNKFEGRILRSSIIHEATLNNWSIEPFEILKPLFENIYDAAGLKRPG